MSSEHERTTDKKSWESVHICPNCGFAINLTAIDMRTITTGIVECPRCDWIGPVENNKQTPEEILLSTLTKLPDEKLTQFALRLVLTGHRSLHREALIAAGAERACFAESCGSEKRGA